MDREQLAAPTPESATSPGAWGKAFFESRRARFEKAMQGLARAGI
jgi:hypothetical protein